MSFLKCKQRNLDISQKKTFAQGNLHLIRLIKNTKDPLVERLLRDELDLRNRRLRQWKNNPSGKPEDNFKSVTVY